LIEIIRSTELGRRALKLERIASRSVALDAELMRVVSKIVEDVRERGDFALIDYTKRFDGIDLKADELRVDEHSLRASAERVDAKVLEALREAIKRVRAFHEREREDSWEMAETQPGVYLGQRITPIERAGLYVPGGKASYPSSVVMNVVPAQVAGVERIVVVTPPRTLNENPAIAAALRELNVWEVYAVGGAQAIAALAYGTETVPRVDKITGPGNKYVAAAKKLVFGTVGIDSIAGPSEVVIIADESARADYIAADLLAQAEHDEEASSVLLTDSDALASRVAAEVEKQARNLLRSSVIEASLTHYGAIIVVDNLDEACALANELAPEHVEIVARDAEALAARVRHAGAIFLGSETPEAVGDYLAGPNHVLPTCRTARFASALGVYDFVKRTSILRYSPGELARTAPMIAALAEAEGLDAHARSALIRLESVESVESVESDRSITDLIDSIDSPDSLEKIKRAVRGLRAYSLTPDRGSVKINQNENPWDAPAAIKQETFGRLSERAWSRYPDFVATSLHERLAAFAGWRPEGIIAGNGSNELIQALLMVTVGEGKRVLISEPTFALYRQITTVLGGEVLSVPLGPALTYDVEAMRHTLETSKPDVTIICSPNNPTGCLMPERDLVALLEVSDGLVVVDEAYHEFAGESVVALLEAHENLVVLRTFSKAMAMAALRVGYLLAAPLLAREISKAVLPYNLNAVSQTAAEVAVEMYEAELRPLVQRIIAERERLFVELQSISGLMPVPSEANFMIVRSAIEPRRVFAELLRRDILIRDVSGHPMLKDYFRVSVGTPTENDRLLSALREIFA
jgi:histidinol dehydrogenase